jgi:hypothetical protein
MSIKITTLKTGTILISELKEVYDGEGEDRKGICLLVERPYELSLVNAAPQYMVEEAGAELQVKFSKWNPYSSDNQFKLPYDSVMTIGEPEEGLKDAYVAKIAEVKLVEEVNNEQDGVVSAGVQDGNNSQSVETAE